ncbi:hypothetical protein FB381_1656 [Nocardioides albertanoniae]|uniref:Inositol polyphosphate-related phosphatase domain-containing protein n=1 Tax=Nocardioides albertanoniae TaxID=1175486 RepID=A0A543A5D9_9ACTN|nr:endonuclease [Nocardioides albertanoniae]TQL67774.1 hypothetical protein FB381_1656 [Nocardioides albertanoniae]
MRLITRILAAAAVAALPLTATGLSPAAAGTTADAAADTVTIDGAAAGTFRALTYNIAGLPEFLSSAPTPREEATLAIGERIGDFDIVNAQEDFNYHAYLYRTDTHAHRTPTSGGVPFGSGLNSVQHQPYEALDRVTWDDCYLNQADCLTPKGFTFRRVQLADGVWLDVYNLHADAGDAAGDEEARRSNLAQVTAYLQEHSAGRPVLIMGDTNTRYTTPGDRIAQFAADNGLTDAWVQIPRGGDAPEQGEPPLGCPSDNPGTDCEVVDKVLYRSGGGVSLEATSYENLDADFRYTDGQMLSDHFPIAVGFSWSAE